MRVTYPSGLLGLSSLHKITKLFQNDEVSSGVFFLFCGKKVVSSTTDCLEPIMNCWCTGCIHLSIAVMRYSTLLFPFQVTTSLICCSGPVLELMCVWNFGDAIIPCTKGFACCFQWLATNDLPLTESLTFLGIWLPLCGSLQIVLKQYIPVDWVAILHSTSFFLSLSIDDRITRAGFLILAI